MKIPPPTQPEEDYKNLFSANNRYHIITISQLLVLHMGPEHASRDKKLPMVNFFIFGQMNIYKRIPEDENPPIKGF